MVGRTLFTVLALACVFQPDEVEKSTEETLSAEQFYQKGLSKLYGDWDYREGKKAFLKAIAKDPKMAKAYAQLGWYTILEQDRETAERYIVKAKMLEPQNASWVLWHAWICYFFRDYDRTEQYIDDALAIDPRLSEAHYLKGIMYYQLEKTEESIHWLNLAAKDPGRPYARGMSNFLQNKKAEALGNIRELEGKEINNKGWYLVVAYALLGEKDEALDYLEESYRKNPVAPWFQFDPIVQPYLEDEARFQELIEKIGRPDN